MALKIKKAEPPLLGGLGWLAAFSLALRWLAVCYLTN
jgi:hypothetical protein